MRIAGRMRGRIVRRCKLSGLLKPHSPGGSMLRRSCPVLVWLLLQGLLYGQASSRKQLSLEAIFRPGSLTGTPPEGLHWAPDQKSFSYIERDEAGEHGQLWLVNAATGEKKVLVSEDKLARLAPPVTSIPDDR